MRTIRPHDLDAIVRTVPCEKDPSFEQTVTRDDCVEVLHVRIERIPEWLIITQRGRLCCSLRGALTNGIG